MFVKRKDMERLTENLRVLNEALEQAADRAVLLGIERKGRKLVFTFVRGEQVHQIETVACLSDNMKDWKDKLLR